MVPTGDGLLVLVDDVTEQHRAESRAELLVEVGEALAGALTAERVNAVLVERAFPLIGAVAGTIVLADEERGLLHALGGSGADDDVEEQWTEYPLSVATPGGAAYLIGEPVFLADLDEVRARFPAVAPTLERLGRHTLAALPLSSAGTRLGALLVDFDSRRRLGTGERQFLTTTAAMAPRRWSGPACSTPRGAASGRCGAACCPRRCRPSPGWTSRSATRPVTRLLGSGATGTTSSPCPVTPWRW